MKLINCICILLKISHTHRAVTVRGGTRNKQVMQSMRMSRKRSRREEIADNAM
jgi:hypothetical protein